MGYLIAYLLLALVIDLIRELLTPDTPGSNAAAIRRRLWSDTDFDCCSRVFGMEGSTFFKQSLRKPNVRPSKPRQGWRPWLSRKQGVRIFLSHPRHRLTESAKC